MDPVNTRKAWWLYSIIRIAIFAVLFALLWMLFGYSFWWLAAILAAIISASISIIWLDPLRQRAAEGLQAWRNKQHTDDDLVEDAALDADPTLLDQGEEPER